MTSCCFELFASPQDQPREALCARCSCPAHLLLFLHHCFLLLRLACRVPLFQLADFYDDDYVNMGPTLALGVPIFLFFLAASVFLEVYVLSTATAHLAIFAVGSYVVFSTYFVADHFMRAHSASYDAIADDKKFYVLSNLIKSAVLLAYTPSCIYTLYRAMNLDEWSTPRIRNMGVLYAIPDTVSLLLVTRMAWSTRVHHLCVVGFMVVNLFVTYEEETVARALVVYAVFSTFAYLVNLLLASRFLPVSPRLSLTLSVVALVIYSGCLAINWIWQVGFLDPSTRQVSSSVPRSPARTCRPLARWRCMPHAPHSPIDHSQPQPATAAQAPAPSYRDARAGHLVYPSRLVAIARAQVRYLGRLYSSGLSLMHGSSVLFYLGLISLVVRDDCVLVKWLWKNVGRQWDSAVASKAAAKGSHDGQQALSDHERKKM